MPHAEIDLILVNGDPAGFSYILRQNGRISIYPVFVSFDLQPLNKLRPQPLRTPIFILDVNLGKLAKYLMLTGFDTLYKSNYADKYYDAFFQC